eukprot:1019051-Pelagomonas_calceolata.AAC.4
MAQPLSCCTTEFRNQHCSELYTAQLCFLCACNRVKLLNLRLGLDLKLCWGRSLVQSCGSRRAKPRWVWIGMRIGDMEVRNKYAFDVGRLLCLLRLSSSANFRWMPEDKVIAHTFPCKPENKVIAHTFPCKQSEMEVSATDTQS